MLLSRCLYDKEPSNHVAVAAAAEISSCNNVHDGVPALVSCGLYREACDLLQDAGCWYDAWNLAMVCKQHNAIMAVF